MRALFMRVASIFRRGWLDAALDEEVSVHLDLLAADYERQGLRPEEARHAARRAFGGIEPMKERYRRRRGFPGFDAAAQDVRYALRQLQRAPGFAASAVLTLGMSIGAVTAVFGVVNAILLRPLPFAEPERLVAINQTSPGLGSIPVGDHHFAEWQRSLKTLEEVALIWAFEMSLGSATGAERVPVGRVSPSLFRALGVRPHLGRLLRDDEDAPGRNRVVVLSDELWRSRFGGDSKIVDRTIDLDGERYDVVGVLPEGFRFIPVRQLYTIPFGGGQPQVWTPLGLGENELIRGFNFAAIGRLRPGVSLATAQSDMDALQRTLPQGDLGLPGPVGAELVPLQERVTSRSRTGLQLLFAAVGVVMVIACVNLASLLLARTSGRGREVAVRTAIGATRARVLRQFVTEGVVLAVLGGALGLAVAAVAMRVLVTVAPSGLPRLDEVGFDRTSIAFAMLLSVAAGVAIGLVPAWRVARVHSQEVLQAASVRDHRGRAARRMQSALVIAEIALSAGCLVAAGLLARSFVNLLTVDKGFDTSNLLTVDVSFAGPRYSGPSNALARLAVQRAMVEAVAALPGVTTVGTTTQQVLSGEGFNTRPLAEGSLVPPPQRPLSALRGVGADYFSAMGIRVVRGRVFADTEAGRVAVISSALAERLWPGENPVGRRFRRGSDTSPLIDVIGVVDDVRAIRLDAMPTFSIYLPYAQFSLGQIAMAIKVEGDPSVIASEAVKAIRKVEPELAVSAVRPMDDVLIASIAERRFLMGLVLMFASVAIVLVGIGVYGVLAYAVGQRRPEIGLRLALGARRRVVWRAVMLDAGKLVTAGLAAGVALVLAAGHQLTPLLFDVVPQDAATVAAACLLVAVMAALAAFVPARRASLVDPMVTLRGE